LSRDRRRGVARPQTRHNVAVTRRFALLLALALVAAPACGKYTRRRGDGAVATTVPGNVAVGGDLQTITSTPGVTRTTLGGAGPSATLPPDKPGANQSRYTSPQGFELTLTVDGQLKYSRTDEIKLELNVKNVSSKPLQFDPNDLRNFALRIPGQQDAVWTDGNCRPARVPKALETHAQTFNPNEQGKFLDTYPGPAESANRDDCRVPNGTYVVFGFISWCPPGTTDEDTGVCDPTRTVQVTSAGVQIRIG
jgi:hypothetical protein